MQKASVGRAEVFLVGDFNIDLSKSNPQKTEFLNWAKCNGLLVQNSQPTRITESGESLIDLVLTRVPVQVNTENWHISDHHTLIVELDKAQKAPLPRVNKGKFLNSEGLTRTAEEVIGVDWDSWIQENDRNATSGMVNFQGVFSKIIGRHSKTRKCTKAGLRQPWYTQALRAQKKELNKMFALCCSSKSFCI